jgi:GNAT superfamily N-acetyltransferase
MKIVVRSANANDRSFMLATWLQNYRRESYFAARIKDSIFYANHHEIADKLLAQETALVACPDDDSDTILGYIVVEPKVLHWVYVKKAFRKMGIATRLLEASGLPANLHDVQVTHPTKLWFTTKQHGPGFEEKYPGAIYNPYRAF